MTLTDREAADRHKYRLLSGVTVPSVTTISGLLDIDGKSSAFAGAAAKITREGGDHRKQWREKAERGTRIHSACEAWLKGEPVEVQEGDEGFLDALEKWMIAEKPVVVESEFVVLSEVGYGGRGDLILDDGSLWDIKSGRVNAIEHTLQLALYRYADGVARFADNGALDRIDPTPLRRIRKAGCLHVHEDGTYDMIEYKVDHEAFCAAKQLLDVYRWAKGLGR